ncbi:hypothetical protein [Phycicoccus sp. Root101]|uniref:hypothetical protein n=1 Tax=Phycicoccus sp. Root101 TaxID=1736421 RepID=UPI000702408D|nr:hypothetical protein [Phycicoccus sp. Root101]KQU68831.1 hypothetical protein ASC58_09100 [Phycicoccus sp. Root101]
MILALLAALVGTLGYGAGSVLQSVGASRASGVAVARQPTYVAGLAFDAVAWMGSLVALRQLPLFAVQALLAGSLAVTVVLARLVLGVRVRRREGVAAAVITAALVVLAAGAGPLSAVRPPRPFSPVMLVSLGVLAVATVLAGRRARSTELAVLGGVAFSGAALCARAAHGSGDWASLLHEPLAWAVLGYGALGMIGYTGALEHGSVGPATAILWVVEVALPAVVGVWVLGDAVRPGWAAPAVLALLLALGACVVLAAAPGQSGGATVP